MKCSKCGAEMREGSKFCVKCGASANSTYSPPHKINSKKTIPRWIWIMMICIVAVIIIACELVFVIQNLSRPSIESLNNDASNNSSLSTTSSMKLKSDFFGTWYTISGADDHYIVISNGGTLTVCDELIDGVDTATSKYEIISSNKISVTLEDDFDKFEFEYSDGLLIRYEHGERDGYIYSKEKPKEFLNSKITQNITNLDVSTSSSPIDEQKPTTHTDIEYSLEYLKNAIRAWNNYENYGAPCGFSEEWVYPEAWEFLNESQVQWVKDLRCSECCCSIDEVRAHLEQYLHKRVYETFDSNKYVEYRGFLYIAIGEDEYVKYDTNLSEEQVVRTAYNKIHVITKQYGTNEEYLCDMRIDFEYINGSYKIVKVTDFE